MIDFGFIMVAGQGGSRPEQDEPFEDQATDSDEEYDLEFVDEDEDDDEETDDSFSEGEESEGGSGPASNTRARAAAGFPGLHTIWMGGSPKPETKGHHSRTQFPPLRTRVTAPKRRSPWSAFGGSCRTTWAGILRSGTTCLA